MLTFSTGNFTEQAVIPTYTVMAKYSPLVNMNNEGCENESALLILLTF